ncbi:hypothetical protein TBLA_0J00650 [Henningerozyma blattae CBS 6284]|uniref:Cyclin N-terminal domain-containing protein n=1 Tax=Henningerozyma blattae (strain ATCC 34711 / CBS 6284 / DSM 70876 / NBRC 10599 / NRRL Y-10934 / UCD 77-7) TaxID=1071380 RepID=I2H9L3_HENB6|nr:hypothetical protein TBLA_0J00650 [Tetrapisispora blattae CBS 6284]CCH63065.1 hypothetical protein TBLA_0J00650 [Tetrapisispora blattae CBS 6284]
MSDYEALLQFNRKRVNNEMIDFLVSTTNSIIQIESETSSTSQQIPSLALFIKRLIVHSNVQTPTLMSTLVYLTKLREIIPSDVVGIETTRHRIFIGCLILAAKSLNDSSPLNRHWTQYTNGLFKIQEINTIERELLEYFNWDVTIKLPDLYTSLSAFLQPIKEQLVLSRDTTMLKPKVFGINNSNRGSNTMGAAIQRPITPSSSAHSSIYSRYNQPSTNRSNISLQSSRASSQRSIPSLYSSSTIASGSTINNLYANPNYNESKMFTINESKKMNSNIFSKKQNQNNYTNMISNPYNTPLTSNKENVPTQLDLESQIPSFTPVHNNQKNNNVTRPIFLKSSSSKSSLQSTKSIKKSAWHTIFG